MLRLAFAEVTSSGGVSRRFARGADTVYKGVRNQLRTLKYERKQ